MANFIPDLKVHEVVITYYEDAAKLEIPGRATTKTIEKLQSEIKSLLTKLGAFDVTFVSGRIDTTPKRYGYQICFRFANSQGRMDCAALPLKNETPAKKDAALRQALYMVRDKVEAEYYSSFFEPGSIPLVPYLIGANGKTVTEALLEAGNLPILGNGR